MITTRPANMFSVRSVCHEYQMRYPRPNFAATNSAAMITIRAVPRLEAKSCEDDGKGSGG